MASRAEDLKHKFLKIFANLPVGVREEIVVHLDKVGPMTWNACYIEVNNDTVLSEKILIELDEMKIL